jgi:hypothetical protein
MLSIRDQKASARFPDIVVNAIIRGVHAGRLVHGQIGGLYALVQQIVPQLPEDELSCMIFRLVVLETKVRQLEEHFIVLGKDRPKLLVNLRYPL